MLKRTWERILQTITYYCVKPAGYIKLVTYKSNKMFRKCTAEVDHPLISPENAHHYVRVNCRDFLMNHVARIYVAGSSHRLHISYYRGVDYWVMDCRIRCQI